MSEHRVAFGAEHCGDPLCDLCCPDDLIRVYPPQPVETMVPPTAERLLRDLHQAEYEAWKNLARYKFWMFGYFAGRWVYLNRLIGVKRPSPFKEIVDLAKARTLNGKST